MLRQMFCAINGAMLSSGAAERDLQMLKIALDKTLYMVIHKSIDRVQERQYLAVLFQKIYDRLIQARQGFEFFVFAGIMGTSAVKHISASVTGFIGRDTAFKGE